MFDPIDFLELAKKIRTSTFPESEASMRTVVSRSYYSSFLLSKTFAIDQGCLGLREYDKPSFPRPGEIHVAVRNALSDLHLGHIASLLLELFLKRVDSDYYLHLHIDEGIADDALELSEKIKQLIAEYK